MSLPGCDWEDCPRFGQYEYHSDVGRWFHFCSLHHPSGRIHIEELRAQSQRDAARIKALEEGLRDLIGAALTAFEGDSWYWDLTDADPDADVWEPRVISCARALLSPVAAKEGEAKE